MTDEITVRHQSLIQIAYWHLYGTNASLKEIAITHLPFCEEKGIPDGPDAYTYTHIYGLFINSLIWKTSWDIFEMILYVSLGPVILEVHMVYCSSKRNHKCLLCIKMYICIPIMCACSSWYRITFIHLADPFIQSDLQLLYMSEITRLWSN